MSDTKLAYQTKIAGRVREDESIGLWRYNALALPIGRRQTNMVGAVTSGVQANKVDPSQDRGVGKKDRKPILTNDFHFGHKTGSK